MHDELVSEAQIKVVRTLGLIMTSIFIAAHQTIKPIDS